MCSEFDNQFHSEIVCIELNIASLYRLFAAEHPKDKKLWMEMARKEEMSATAIRMLEKPFIDYAAVLLNSPNYDRLKDLNVRISSYAILVKRDGIARRQTFDIAMRLESLIYELEFRKILSKLNVQGIIDIFSIISEPYQNNKNMLKRYIKEHSL